MIFLDEDDDDEACLSDGNQQTNERTGENDDDKQNDENSPSASSGQPVSKMIGLISFLTNIKTYQERPYPTANECLYDIQSTVSSNCSFTTSK